MREYGAAVAAYNTQLPAEAVYTNLPAYQKIERAASSGMEILHGLMDLMNTDVSDALGQFIAMAKRKDDNNHGKPKTKKELKERRNKKRNGGSNGGSESDKRAARRRHNGGRSHHHR